MSALGKNQIELEEVDGQYYAMLILQPTLIKNKFMSPLYKESFTHILVVYLLAYPNCPGGG